MSESAQHKLSKVRPPRVQITYDVEVGDEVQMKELPLVVGVMSDLSGKSEKDKGLLKDRKFIDIDGENFNEVMTSIEPKVEMTVPNKLTDEEGSIRTEIKFKTMDDFNPYSVVQQVEPLRKLYEARSHLNDLLGKLDGNDKLENILAEVVENTPSLEEIKAASAPKEDAAGGDDAPAADGDSADGTDGE